MVFSPLLWWCQLSLPPPSQYSAIKDQIYFGCNQRWKFIAQSAHWSQDSAATSERSRELMEHGCLKCALEILRKKWQYCRPVSYMVRVCVGVCVPVFLALSVCTGLVGASQAWQQGRIKTCRHQRSPPHIPIWCLCECVCLARMTFSPHRCHRWLVLVAALWL